MSKTTTIVKKTSTKVPASTPAKSGKAGKPSTGKGASRTTTTNKTVVNNQMSRRDYLLEKQRIKQANITDPEYNKTQRAWAISEGIQGTSGVIGGTTTGTTAVVSGNQAKAQVAENAKLLDLSTKSNYDEGDDGSSSASGEDGTLPFV